MSAIIQALNDWGGNFLSFAWPMLWQSSLLIAFVFAFDALFARRIRAAVRYALWLAVLVKLLLPPALALPTGATWWLWRARPAPAPVINSEVVTFDATDALPPVSVPQTTVPFTPPPPELTGAGWAVLGCAVIGVALLLWLAFRWLRVAAKVRRAPASGDFAPTLQDAGQLGRLRHCPRLKLVDDVQSPAVYGLFSPVILLPRALAEKLSVRQLRAVLLHEAVHLRRGDVWINCAQTLLQIAYWWHPLLWLANARIRRLREEAVDDAVMLALRGDADAYAPTLLEVAKFSFRRPLAGLALVGILESRSALRRRIERLMDFRPPRKAGLTALSLCGIFVFSAIALPMGQGPAETEPMAQGVSLPHVPLAGGGVAGVGESANAPATTQPAKPTIWPWPDPDFAGIRYVYLTAQFLILDDAQLKAANPSLADNPGPTPLSPDETADFLNRLQKVGARCFCQGWENGIHQAPVSGGHEYYEIGGSTNGISMIELLTTNFGGSYSNIYCGERVLTPATQPDWTPMNLTLRALCQDGGALCQMDLSFPNTGARSVHSEILLPTYDALVWVSHPPTAPGKCQVVFLTPTFDRQKISEMVQEAERAYRAGHFDEAESNLNRVLWVDPHNPEAQAYLVLAKARAAMPQADPPIVFSPTNSLVLPPSNPASINTTDQNILTGSFLIENSIPKDSLIKALQDAGVRIPPTIVVYLNSELLVRGTADQLAEVRRVVWKLNGVSTKAPPMITGPGRRAIYSKMERIHLDTVAYAALPLSEVIRDLHEQSQLHDPDKTGINFFFNPNAAAGTSINPSTGLPVKTPANSGALDDTQITINLRVNHASLGVLLNRICAGSDRPIQYSVEDYGVVFSPADTNAPQYEMRTFKVDVNTFYSNLVAVTHSDAGVYPPLSASAAAKMFFESLGLNLDPPKQAYFNDRLGVLFVYATPQDLDVIERAIQVLNEKPQPINHHADKAQSFQMGTNVSSPNLWKVTSPQIQASDINASAGISEQTESALNQALAQERSAAHMDLTAQAQVNSSQIPFRRVIDPITGLPVFGPIFGSALSSPVNPDGLETQTFFVGTAAFSAAIRQKTGEPDVVQGFKELADQAGVDLSPPKQVYFSEGMGRLHIEATTNDLKAIRNLIAGLHCPPPMVHIKARFIEVPKKFFAEANSLPAGLTNGGVLTQTQARKLLRQIESFKGTTELAEPEVTTICGRQTEMRATIIQPVITNYVVVAQPTNSYDNVAPQVCQIETGSILDVVPMSLQGGYTLDLWVAPSEVEFLGYADTEGLPKRHAIDAWGDKIELPNVLPLFKVNETTMQKTLYDGQTLVLEPPTHQLPPGTNDEKWSERIADFFRPKKEDKVLVVLVTATLIDAAGNRVHSDAELPFAQNQVPQYWP